MRRPALRVLSAIGFLLLLPAARAFGAPFPFLQPGFTQGLWAVTPGFLGGIAFAPDGDVCSDPCNRFDTRLHRFDLQATLLVHGTLVHPSVAGSPFPSGADCGLVSHPNGDLYANAVAGLTRLSPAGGAVVGGPTGPAGNGLGVTVDPQSPHDLVYVASDGTLIRADQDLTTFNTFSTVTQGHWVDGITFDPTGNFMFCASRSLQFRLYVLRRDGSLVQLPLTASEPDGIAFHSGPMFVLTNNTDGTLTRFDFPQDDFTQVPIQSTFASGGFRGEGSQVGPDGCVYLTQNGSRYDDGTVTTENSIVRICGGFTPVATRRTSWGRLKAWYR